MLRHNIASEDNFELCLKRALKSLLKWVNLLNNNRFNLFNKTFFSYFNGNFLMKHVKQNSLKL